MLNKKNLLSILLSDSLVGVLLTRLLSNSSFVNNFYLNCAPSRVFKQAKYLLASPLQLSYNQNRLPLVKKKLAIVAPQKWVTNSGHNDLKTLYKQIATNGANKKIAPNSTKNKMFSKLFNNTTNLHKNNSSLLVNKNLPLSTGQKVPTFNFLVPQKLLLQTLVQQQLATNGYPVKAATTLVSNNRQVSSIQNISNENFDFLLPKENLTNPAPLLNINEAQNWLGNLLGKNSRFR